MTPNCFYVCLTLSIFCFAVSINAEPLRDPKLLSAIPASLGVGNQNEGLIPIASEEDQTLDKRTKRHGHHGGHWGGGRWGGGHWGGHRRHHHYGGYGGQYGGLFGGYGGYFG